METALFKPISNSFTIFINKSKKDLEEEKVPKLTKKRSKKKTKNIQIDNDEDFEYVKIDFAKCIKIVNDSELFSFKKRWEHEDKRRIEYLNADEIFKNTAKHVSHNLVENWARYVNLRNPGFIKRYCIGRVYTMKPNNAFWINHPEKQWQACFDICMSRNKGYLYKDDEDEGIDLNEELMHEVEVLYASYQVVAKYSKILGNVKIVLNSTIILDLFFSEWDIELKLRHKILQILSQINVRPWNKINKELNESYSIPRKSIEKLGKLFRISGELDQVKKEIEGFKGLLYKDEILETLSYFDKFVRYWEWVGINPNWIVFDLGMILDQFYIFYTGLVFKIVCTSNIEEQPSKKNSTKQHIMERFISYGGRYDNCISHFDIPTRASNIFAVGSCINLSEIVNAGLQALDDSKQMSKFRDRIDICIFSNESYQEQGMKLLSTFWRKGFKGKLLRVFTWFGYSHSWLQK